MKILVTGAAGFIGSYVLNELASQQHSIIATSRRPQLQSHHLKTSSITYIPHDINSSDTNLFQYFNQPTHLIHLAWQNLPHYQDLSHYEIYLHAHYRFLKNLIDNGLRHLTIVGTCLEYGYNNGCLNEDMSTEPQVPYALAKDTLRRFLQIYQKKINFSLRWIRLFYVYGLGQNQQSLYSQIQKAIQDNCTSFPMSGGEQLRDYLPIEKAAYNIVRIATQNNVQGIINCCSGTPISIRKFVETIIGNHPISLELGRYPYPDYEPFAFWGSRQKLDYVLRQTP